MTVPFIVYALPRSRSFWLSRFLSYGGRRVGHDIAAFSDNCQGFFEAFWGMHGIVETGACVAHRLIKTVIPDVRTVTIRRPVGEVIQSLERLGVTGMAEEMELRDAFLNEIESDGGYSVRFSDLSDYETCCAIFESVTGEKFDFEWCRSLIHQNLQVDFAARMKALSERADKIDAFKREAALLTVGITDGLIPKFYHLGWEAFDTFIKDAETLIREHHKESGSDDGPLILDAPLLSNLDRANLFKVLTARCNGRLIGYMTFTFVPNAESAGMMIADQGAWYVDPDASKCIGARMLWRAVADLRRIGVRRVQFHSPVKGRGADLGRAFRAIGAIETQRRYAMAL